MPFCKNCGKEVNENAKFCSGCGASLTGETPSSNPQQNSTAGTPCPKCGSIIPLGNVACTNCGSLLNPDKHTTAIVLGYICSVFLPLFGIIFGSPQARDNYDNPGHSDGHCLVANLLIYSLYQQHELLQQPLRRIP